FLKKLMRFHPMPVIVISSLGQASSKIALEALQHGAVDVLAKPGGPYSVGELQHDLPHKVRAAAHARLQRASAQAPVVAAAVRPPPISLPPGNPSAVIAIGASAGGTEAIREVLMGIPASSPGIVV